nr:tRNA glutamyl-Q(34) synthetase GluQRS [Nitratireductor sp.]
VLMPVLAAMFLRRGVNDKETLLIRWVQAAYQPLLRIAMARPIPVAIGTLSIFLGSLWLAKDLGAVFVPRLDEEALAIQAIRLPSVSLESSVSMTGDIERTLRQFQPVESVISKTGRPEIATDPMTVNLTDIIINLKPRSEWIGFEWDEPPRRQSEHFGEYKSALDGLEARGLVYPAFMSRGQIKAHAAAHPHWPKDPDGAPLYPGNERELNRAHLHKMMGGGEDFALRLDMARAIAQTGSGLRWQETGKGPEGQTGLLTADPLAWGDVILGRKDVPASYHLSCVLDDASQGVTHVVRGADLFHATSVHCVLQDLLGLPRPVYHHHRLVPGPDGRKLSKSRADTALCHLREAGATPQDIRRMIGL